MTANNENDVDAEQPLLSSSSDRRWYTPLPKVQLGTLLLVQFPEPIVAFVIFPFIAELVNRVATGGDEKQIGFYAGLIESIFFLTQGCFMFAWNRLSDHIGRKPVLLSGLVGLCLSMICFGLSTSFWGIVASRAIAGALCGNIGVAKTVIAELTDETNIAVAFSFMPMIWGAGITIGPLIGGFFFHPAERWPSVFGSPFWIEHPQALPCFVAASVCIPAFLSCFFFFKETNPLQLSTPATTPETAAPLPEIYGALESVLPKTQTQVKQSLPPLREALTPRTITALSVYVMLAFIDICVFAFVPVFLASPVHLGGLGFLPPTIGSILGFFGILNTSVQIFIFPVVQRKYGTKRSYTSAVASFFLLVLGFPLLNALARATSTTGAEDAPLSLWIAVAIHFTLMTAVDIAFSSAFITIAASVDNKATLGAVNGIAQTMASFIRAIGPSGTNSLFALTVANNLAGGYLVYLIMLVFVVIALMASLRLPNDKPVGGRGGR